MKKKTIEKITNNFIFDLSDAIIPDNWPKNIPKKLPMINGEQPYEFFLLKSEENWYLDLLKIVKSVSNIDLRINAKYIFPGSFILDDNNNVVFSGENKEEFIQNKTKKETKIKKQLDKLQLIYPKIKPEYLIDFDDVVSSLESSLKNKMNPNHAYDCFNDIFISGGGSTYSDKSKASLGAYNSLLDYNVLDQTLELFHNENLSQLKLRLEGINDISPIFNILIGFVDRKIEKNKSQFKP